MFDLWGRKRVYLDYASAPPVLPEASRALRDAEKLVGNPGAIHAEGVAAKKKLEDSRARVARVLGCKAREIIFTSGLTESNNLAIIGYAKWLQTLRSDLRGSHWLVSSIEHDSVLASFGEVERMGGTVAYMEPDERGIITPVAVERALRPETVFVSVGWANNEIGTVQPLSKIARALERHAEFGFTKPKFHSDAGQAPLYLPTLVHSLGVDLLSLGANKLYGPHGIGGLYLSNTLRSDLTGITFGGKQERGLRAGTESVALAAGFAAAFEIVASEREKESKRIKTLRDMLVSGLVSKTQGLVINGDFKHLLPHMLNVSIPNIQSEYVTLSLDAAGIAVSTKSACREGEESRSHVVAALGSEGWRAKNTLRFSLGCDTKASDIKHVVEELVRIMEI